MLESKASKSNRHQSVTMRRNGTLSPVNSKPAFSVEYGEVLLPASMTWQQSREIASNEDEQISHFVTVDEQLNPLNCAPSTLGAF